MSKLNLQDMAKSEALKEFGRVIAIAVIPVLIDSLQKGLVDFRMIVVVAIIAGLRAVDRYLKKVESDNPVTNFLRFE